MQKFGIRLTHRRDCLKVSTSLNANTNTLKSIRIIIVTIVLSFFSNFSISWIVHTAPGFYFEFIFLQNFSTKLLRVFKKSIAIPKGHVFLSFLSSHLQLYAISVCLCLVLITNGLLNVLLIVLLIMHLDISSVLFADWNKYLLSFSLSLTVKFQLRIWVKKI